MSRADNAPLNIRSAYARSHTRDFARRTSMTTTEIIEDALRGYVLSATSEPIDGLVWRGPVLVKPAQGRHVSQDETNQALDAVRERDL